MSYEDISMLLKTEDGFVFGYVKKLGDNKVKKCGVDERWKSLIGENML